MLQKLFFTCCFCVLFGSAFGQKETYVKVSTGRVFFSEFKGYAVSADLSKNLLKLPITAVNKLLVGGELLHEQGRQVPEDNYQQTIKFSSTQLWAKVAYYPFDGFFKGFNIQVGPSLGYAYRSTITPQHKYNPQTQQYSTIYITSSHNRQMIGYRVSWGMEFKINSRFLTGFRMDFADSEDNGEISTLLGLKFGMRL
jgi:hypothetical protein